MKTKSLETKNAWEATPRLLRYWIEDHRDDLDELDTLPGPDEQAEVVQLQHQLLAWGFRLQTINLTNSMLLYPEFDQARYYESWGDGIIVPINGKRWKVLYEVEPVIKRLDDSGSYHPRYGETIRFELTDEPETEYLTFRSPPEAPYLTFFGQPSFTQNKVLPVHNFQPAKPLFQWKNKWGDDGNENVFLACDRSGNPSQVFLEYSCY